MKSNIDTEIVQKEADKITAKLAEVLKPIDKSLTNIKAMKASIDEAKTQGTDIDTLKTQLQAIDPDLYNQLGLNFLNSPEEILSRLTAHETELTNRKEEIQTQANNAREKLINNQKTKAEQKDIHKKEAGSPKPKYRYKVTNRAEYDRALVCRGDLRLWFDKTFREGWTPPPPQGRGKPGLYSALIIQTCLTLKTLFRLPYRATEGLMKSLMRLNGLDLPVHYRRLG